MNISYIATVTSVSCHIIFNAYKHTQLLYICNFVLLFFSTDDSLYRIGYCLGSTVSHYRYSHRSIGSIAFVHSSILKLMFQMMIKVLFSVYTESMQVSAPGKWLFCYGKVFIFASL